MMKIKKFGTKYDPTPVSALKSVLTILNIKDSDVLVDFGSGKGRVLLVSSEFGFKSVVGVEFSKELCDISLSNIYRYRQKNKKCSPVSVINNDAAKVDIQDDYSVFFFFNPFGNTVLERVIKNIRDSYLKTPRRMYLIYNNPVHAHIVNLTSFLNLKHDIWVYGRRFMVFESDK